MKFIAQLRSEGQLAFIYSNYTIQDCNLDQLPKFVQLARDEWHLDMVSLSRLDNYGAYSTEEYNRINVTSPSHPRYPEMVALIHKLMHNTHGIEIRDNVLSPGIGAPDEDVL